MMKYVELNGGLDEVTRGVELQPGRLIRCKNVECKQSNGYRVIKGYSKFDANEVTGEGNILGVWGYNGKVYAIRNAVGGATAVMYESTGSGWTSKKTGLTPSGSYQFSNENIDGTQKMYGASGVHLAFQWDGTTWTDLTTGLSPDTPEFVMGFKKHLFAASGADVHNSSLGDATTWSAITGATQIRMESDVTGFQRMTGGKLGIFSRNSVGILAGSVAGDFIMTNMSQHGNNMGCIAGTLQQMGSRVFFTDDIGVMDFYTTDRFGDFADATLSQAIQPTIESKKDSVVASCVVKSKSQYRVFFSDKTGIIATFNGNKLMGWTSFLLPLQVKTICNTEDANGNEKIYFGSTDGYIYELESTNAFDTAGIDAYMLVAPTHLGTPFDAKRFRRAQFDMQTGGNVTVEAKPVFYFKEGGTLTYNNISVSGLTGGILGEMLLGTGVLGGSDIVAGQLDMPGRGEYVGMNINSTDSQAQWEVDGINYHYEQGRRKRN